MNDMAILYGIPKVAYGVDGCTPFPMCICACAKYLGRPVSYSRAMVESGAAFRLTWDTSCWNGGNVDVILAYDDPSKIYACGLRAMDCSFRMLGRTATTKKEDFIAFIRSEIDSGYPVIALGVIGPPEACVITGYRDGGEKLMGWNVFQEYPEHQSHVRFEQNGYFITDRWWDNPDTLALFSTGSADAAPFSLKEILQNAIEVLSGRMCGNYAKGILAYHAWKHALLDDRTFSGNAIIPLLVERMMCHGDAMDCLCDGRQHAALYLRQMTEFYPEHAHSLNAAANEFANIPRIIHEEMIPVLGGWERGEYQIHQLAKAEIRRFIGNLIDRMCDHDTAGLNLLKSLVERL